MDDLVNELSSLVDKQYEAYLTNKGPTSYVSRILLKSTFMEYLAHVPYQQLFSDGATDAVYSDTLGSTQEVDYVMASEAFERLAKYGANLWETPSSIDYAEVKVSSERWIYIAKHLKHPERMLTSLGYFIKDAETYSRSEASMSISPFAHSRDCILASQDLLQLKRVTDTLAKELPENSIKPADILACRKITLGNINLLAAKLKLEYNRTQQEVMSPSQSSAMESTSNLQLEPEIVRKQFVDVGVVTEVIYPPDDPQPRPNGPEPVTGQFATNSNEHGHDLESLNEQNGDVETLSTVLAQAEEFSIQWNISGIGSLRGKRVRSLPFTPKNGITAHTWQLQVMTTNNAQGDEVLGLHLMLVKFGNPYPPKIRKSWFYKRTMRAGFELEIIGSNDAVLIGVGDRNVMVDFGVESCWGNTTIVTLGALRNLNAISEDILQIRCRVRWYNDD